MEFHMWHNLHHLPRDHGGSSCGASMQRSAHERVACVHSGASRDELAAAVVHGVRGRGADHAGHGRARGAGAAREVCGGEQPAGERQERDFLFAAKGFFATTRCNMKTPYTKIKLCSTHTHRP